MPEGRDRVRKQSLLSVNEYIVHSLESWQRYRICWRWRFCQAVWKGSASWPPHRQTSQHSGLPACAVICLGSHKGRKGCGYLLTQWVWTCMMVWQEGDSPLGRTRVIQQRRSCAGTGWESHHAGVFLKTLPLDVLLPELCCRCACFQQLCLAKGHTDLD